VGSWIKGGRTTVDAIGGIFVHPVCVDYWVGYCDVGYGIFGAGFGGEECGEDGGWSGIVRLDCG